jgi:hypothetical protein
MHFKDKRVLSIKTTDDMLKILNSKGNALKDYKKGAKITVYNKMEKIILIRCLRIRAKIWRMDLNQSTRRIKC